PRNNQTKDSRRRQTRRHQRQNDSAKRSETRVSVNHGSLFQIARHFREKPTHHPDNERQIESRVNDDERQTRIHQTQVTHDQKQRHRRHNRRHHARPQNPQRQFLVEFARQPKPGQLISRQRSQQQRASRRTHGHHKAVQQ